MFFVAIVLILKNLLLNNLKIFRKISLFFGGIINIPILSTYGLVPLLNFGSKIMKRFDQGWLELMGGQGFINKVIFSMGEGDRLNYINLKIYLSAFLLVIFIC